MDSAFDPRQAHAGMNLILGKILKTGQAGLRVRLQGSTFNPTYEFK